MSRRVAALACALLAGGCVSERVIAVELLPPRDGLGGPAVPEDIVSWELWLERLDDGQGCGAVEDAAAGRAFGAPAAFQSFDRATGMGTAFGEVPEGRWSLRAIARTAACEPRLYGCTEFSLDADLGMTVTVSLEEVVTAETCGCRACEAGVCEESVCR